MWWIRHALTRAKQDQDRPIRVPVHQDDRARILRKLKIKYMQAHDGKEPTIEQLFEMEGHHARTTPKAIQQFLESQALYFVSLDAPINNKFDGDSQQLADILPVDQSSEQEEERVKVMRQVLDEVLVKLPDREREILMARFGLVDGQEMTLQEIGTRDNLSRERIRQVQEKALKHLHAYLARRGITRISAVA
jgi:RNA polymerase sigma factor (sigma-70 family)